MPTARDGALPSAAATTALALGAGALLVASAVCAKLVGSTYRRDVQTICDAERRSGYALGESMADVTAWTRANLTTPEGNELFTTIGYAPLESRAGLLRAEASAVGLRGCAAAASYERLTLDAEYRGDLQRLCSRVTFPDLADQDDAARLGVLTDWIGRQARSPRTRDLAAALGGARPIERAALLRAEARAMAVFSCELARTLDVPRPDGG
ncbi:MAG TPA: hypothetical protein VE987_09960 [Polyangiaceae bacterium]|nr:hypothetical protein [Polyangiaceae bacterium]